MGLTGSYRDRGWAKELTIHYYWCIASQEIKLAGTAGRPMEDRVLNCTTTRRHGLTQKHPVKNKEARWLS